MIEPLKVSVIIPVYNAEKYLNQAVDSILNQTYKNIELILVDDECTDASPEICDEYAQKDKRVRVIHKRNSGASAARNSGIKVMSGDYVLFMDCDDYWDRREAVEEMIKIAEAKNADLVCYGYKEFYEDTKTYKDVIDATSFNINDKSRDEILEILISNGIFISSSWSKMIKTELFKKIDLTFIEHVIPEDIDWSAKLLLVSKSIALYPYNFYVYRQRSGSITHLKKLEHVDALEKHIDRCIKFGQDLPFDRFRELYFNYVAYQYITLLHTTMLCNKSDELDEYIKSAKKNEWLLKYHINQKVRLVYTANRFLGYKFMYKAIKLYLGR